MNGRAFNTRKKEHLRSTTETTAKLLELLITPGPTTHAIDFENASITWKKNIRSVAYQSDI